MLLKLSPELPLLPYEFPLDGFVPPNELRIELNPPLPLELEPLDPPPPNAFKKLLNPLDPPLFDDDPPPPPKTLEKPDKMSLNVLSPDDELPPLDGL